MRNNRRKSKDNPYLIEQIGKEYFVKFKNTIGEEIVMPISYEIFNSFDKFELEDISQMHKFERHIEHSIIYEEKLYCRGVRKEQSILDYLINKELIEDLYQAIHKLSVVQKRRLILYYFYDKTLEQISKIESCSIHSVFVSINRSIDKIKKFLIYSVKN